MFSFFEFLTNINKTIEINEKTRPYKNVASGEILSHIKPPISPPGRATSPIDV